MDTKTIIRTINGSATEDVKKKKEEENNKYLVEGIEIRR